MGVEVNVTKRELGLANQLVEGHQEWSDLKPKDQLVLYECPANLDGVVSEEELIQFEQDLALKGYFGPSGMARAALNKARGKLE